METQAETRQRIKVGRTEMEFQHQGKPLIAVHPFYGPANSLNLLNKIRSTQGIREPTAPEVASFVHEYFNGSEPQAQEVTDIMKKRYFRPFTGILYLPETQTAHFIDKPEFDRNSVVDTNNLISRLSESRAQVAFEHLKEGVVDWGNVVKDPYFVAWAGGYEGAEKLAGLASKHPRKEAYKFTPNLSNLREPIARVAALGSGWVSDRLNVDADGLGGDDGGCAFGVLDESAVGTSPEK